MRKNVNKNIFEPKWLYVFTNVQSIEKHMTENKNREDVDHEADTAAFAERKCNAHKHTQFGPKQNHSSYSNAWRPQTK